eukprot:g21626.t1
MVHSQLFHCVHSLCLVQWSILCIVKWSFVTWSSIQQVFNTISEGLHRIGSGLFCSYVYFMTRRYFDKVVGSVNIVTV